MCSPKSQITVYLLLHGRKTTGPSVNVAWEMCCWSGWWTSWRPIREKNLDTYVVLKLLPRHSWSTLNHYQSRLWILSLISFILSFKKILRLIGMLGLSEMWLSAWLHLWKEHERSAVLALQRAFLDILTYPEWVCSTVNNMINLGATEITKSPQFC